MRISDWSSDVCSSDLVAILDGGWQAWLAAGGVVETGSNSARLTEAQAVQSLNVPGAAAMPTVDAQRVLDNLSNPTFTVLDARAADRYLGKTEPMDTVR